MSRLSVGYRAEVLAVVEDGQVVRVVVLDEGVELNGKVYDVNGNEVTGPEAAAAIAVAENDDLTWPSWEFGW